MLRSVAFHQHKYNMCLRGWKKKKTTTRVKSVLGGETWKMETEGPWVPLRRFAFSSNTPELEHWLSAWPSLPWTFCCPHLASRYEEGAIRYERVNWGKQADVFCSGRPALAGCIILQPWTPKCPLHRQLPSMVHMGCHFYLRSTLRGKLLCNLLQTYCLLNHTITQRQKHPDYTGGLHGGLTHLSSASPSDCIYCSLALGGRLFLVTRVAIASHPMALTC